MAIESTAELSVQKAKVTFSPFRRLLLIIISIVFHRIFSGGDHEVVEGRVAEVEHLSHPPYQQGQIRCPLVLCQGHLSEAAMDNMQSVSLNWQKEHFKKRFFCFAIRGIIDDSYYCPKVINFHLGYTFVSVSFPHTCVWANFHHV